MESLGTKHLIEGSQFKPDVTKQNDPIDTATLPFTGGVSDEKIANALDEVLMQGNEQDEEKAYLALLTSCQNMELPESTRQVAKLFLLRFLERRPELCKIEIKPFTDAAKMTAKMQLLEPQSVVALSMKAAINIDTNEAVIYDKESHFVAYYSDDVLYDWHQCSYRDRKAAFQEENPILVTTHLTACMSVYIESANLCLALHVNPEQAKGTPRLKAYGHLDYAELPRGTEISVMVGGHTRNFDEKIFRDKVAERNLVIKELTIGKSPHHTLMAAFDFKQGKLTVESLTDNPDKFEELTFARAKPAIENSNHP